MGRNRPRRVEDTVNHGAVEFSWLIGFGWVGMDLAGRRPARLGGCGDPPHLGLNRAERLKTACPLGEAEGLARAVTYAKAPAPKESPPFLPVVIQ